LFLVSLFHHHRAIDAIGKTAVLPRFIQLDTPGTPGHGIGIRGAGIGEGEKVRFHFRLENHGKTMAKVQVFHWKTTAVGVHPNKGKTGNQFIPTVGETCRT